MPGAQPRKSSERRIGSSVRRQAPVGLGTPGAFRVRRRPDESEREIPPGGGATSGVVLNSWDGPTAGLTLADWFGGGFPNWVEKDSWGDVAFSWAADAGKVTVPDGVYAVTSIAEVQLATNRAVKVSMDWDDGPPVPGPQVMVYGPSGSSTFGGHASVSGLRNPGAVNAYFAHYDLVTDDAPVTNIPVIVSVTLFIVRLSD